MTKEIYINWKDQKYTVLVDDDAYELLNRHTWYIMYSGEHKKPYAFLEVYSKGIGKRMVYMHQLVTGAFTQTDHENGNSLDNQFLNLRPATYQQNGWNKPKNRITVGGRVPSSRYKGVSKTVSKHGHVSWRVQIGLTKKGIKPAQFLRKYGFKTELEAAKFYNEKIVELRGEWGWINPLPNINHQN